MSTLTIDDNDARIQYTGLWDVYNTPAAQYQSTAHSTWEYDAKAVLKFTGVGVKVYGTLPSGVGTAAVDFSLDGASGVRVWKPSGSQNVFNELYFDSGVLSSGSHTLVMANKGEDNDMDFRLDRVVVALSASTASSTTTNSPTTTSAQGSLLTTAITSPPAGQSSSLTTGSPNASATSTSNTSGSSVSSVPSTSLVVTVIGGQTIISTVTQAPATSVLGSSADATNISAASATGSNSTPKIVGAVVGVVVFLLIILGLLLCWRRRKMAAQTGNAASREESGVLRSMSQSGVTPFTVLPPTSEGQANSSITTYGKSLSQRNLLQSAPPPAGASSGHQQPFPPESQSSTSHAAQSANIHALPGAGLPREKHAFVPPVDLTSPAITERTETTLVFVGHDTGASEPPPSYYPTSRQ